MYETGKQIALRKTVIVISSHVARGSVGNRAAVFALEVLGHPVWAIPTIVLPFHPGHGKATRIVPGDAEFEALLGGRAPTQVVNQCGSGVTACHNLLAMEIAGLGGAALYPGSWSEYSAQPGAPIATGDA